jgi:probable rRNA maturation factor
MVAIELNNPTKYRAPKKKIAEVLASAQKELKIKRDHLISLAFVSPLQIKKLNKTYRHKDKVTDVLSFAHEALAQRAEEALGEIIICPERAEAQSKEFKQSFSREILKLSLHGYLHILGFDHEVEREALIMEALEDKILKKYYAGHQ